MKHLFVSYELALLAKEKGFNEECFGVYNCSRIPTMFKGSAETTCNEKYAQVSEDINYSWVTAPLYQQLVDWFETSKGLHVSLEYVDDVIGFCPQITYLNYTSTVVHVQGNSTNKYEALNTALTESFKLINP